MTDKEKLIHSFKYEAIVHKAHDGSVAYIEISERLYAGICCLLKEQEDEIRQLKLALDIAKGTCKGIVADGR